MLALVIASLDAACTESHSPAQCDPQAFRAVQTAHAGGSEVTVCGTILRVGRIRRTRSGTHRVFVVDAGSNDLVEVDVNLDIIGTLPVAAGQTAIVRGEYYDDGPGRAGVHWTHRTLHGSHPPGYVVLAGTTYQ